MRLSEERPAAQGQEADDIYELLRGAILDGDLKPEEVMSQVALANRLGVSRTPLREALRLLQGEGLIEAEQHRRVRVASMTASDLEELYVMRVALEAEALRLSVPDLTPEDLARLEGYIAEMAHFAETADYRRWTVPHSRFHRALTAPAGQRISALLGQLFDHGERYRRLQIGPIPSSWAIEGHRAILDACKATDRDSAASALANHLARACSEVAEVLDPDYDCSKLTTAVADVCGDVPADSSDRRGSNR